MLDSQRLWGHLTGRTPHPSVPVRPEEPTTRADGALPSDDIDASEQYIFDLSDYKDWAADETRAAQILLGTMKVEFAMDLASLPSTQETWECSMDLY
jgi:hypothetical protein